MADASDDPRDVVTDTPGYFGRQQQMLQDSNNDTSFFAGLGLRLVWEGVSAEDFERRFGVSLDQTYGPALRRLAAQVLVEWPAERARLTRAGRLLGNVVFREFV